MKKYFERILNKQSSQVELTSSLSMLSQMLFEHYGTAPIVIIDEYDTPIQEGYSKDFYNEIIGFMRNFFSDVFKDNKYISYGFLTGIMKIAQESIFSGLNNLMVSSIIDDEYSEYFGFSHAEVVKMLEYYGMQDSIGEIQDWYDGYVFGNKKNLIHCQ